MLLLAIPLSFLFTSSYWKSIHTRPDAYMKQPSGLCSNRQVTKMIDIMYHFEKSRNFYPILGGILKDYTIVWEYRNCIVVFLEFSVQYGSHSFHLEAASFLV
jgi:hypothetical protein